jgi:alanine-glyoxylate transaminase/serine-glyoxylate transaminase/serine-pyruvate transaminase
MLPDGHNADAFRKIVLERFDMSLGQGLGKLSGKVFRIGHLGHFNDLMLCGTLAGVEMGLAIAGVPHRKGGTQAAIDYLADSATAERPPSAATGATKPQGERGKSTAPTSETRATGTGFRS